MIAVWTESGTSPAPLLHVNLPIMAMLFVTLKNPISSLPLPSPDCLSILPIHQEGWACTTSIHGRDPSGQLLNVLPNAAADARDGEMYSMAAMRSSAQVAGGRAQVLEQPSQTQRCITPSSALMMAALVLLTSILPSSSASALSFVDLVGLRRSPDNARRTLANGMVRCARASTGAQISGATNCLDLMHFMRGC